ncbi:MAG: hypothetical protein FJ148_23760 [Deltaproteobacteria bacterium]|nr:hypothetical protein [Deltaproteobacteria bacterium]
MSTQRAFVIHFLQRPGQADAFAGRAEQVGSGETAHFDSPDELIGFLSRLLGRATRPPARQRAAAAAAGVRAAAGKDRATPPGSRRTRRRDPS